MGGNYIVKEKKIVTRDLTRQFSAVLAVNHCVFLLFLFDLDYVLSAGTYQSSSAVRDLKRYQDSGTNSFGA